jgi:hypothetical protein
MIRGIRYTNNQIRDAIKKYENRNKELENMNREYRYVLYGN